MAVKSGLPTFLEEEALAVRVLAAALMVGIGVGGCASPATSPETGPASATEAAGNRLPTVNGPPQPLEAGSYMTPEGFDPPMSVTVPTGWYGAAFGNGFTVGRGLDEVNERYADVGLYVETIPTPYDEAVAAFEGLTGLVHEAEPTPRQIDGHDATTFFAHAAGAPVVLDPIAPGLDIIAEAGPITFIDVDGTTVLVRTEVFDESAESELAAVVDSLSFP